MVSTVSLAPPEFGLVDTPSVPWRRYADIGQGFDGFDGVQQFELLSQPAGQDFDCPREQCGIVATQAVPGFIVRDDVLRFAGKQRQQFEVGAGEFHGRLHARHLAAFEIDRHAVEVQAFRDSNSNSNSNRNRHAGPLQHSLHARGEHDEQYVTRAAKSSISGSITSRIPASYAFTRSLASPVLGRVALSSSKSKRLKIQQRKRLAIHRRQSAAGAATGNCR